MSEYTVQGESSDEVMDTIRVMSRYLNGPGFDGFLAWLNQELTAEGARCPKCGQGVHAKAVRINLSDLETLIERSQT